MLHSRAALVTRARGIRDHGGRHYEVTRSAKACTTLLIVGLCKAQSGSPSALLSVPYSCTALATKERCLTEHDRDRNNNFF